MDAETRIAAVRMALLRDNRVATDLYYNELQFRMSIDMMAQMMVEFVDTLAGQAAARRQRHEELTRMMERSHLTAAQMTEHLREAGVLGPDAEVRFNDTPLGETDGAG